MTMETTTDTPNLADPASPAPIRRMPLWIVVPLALFLLMAAAVIHSAAWSTDSWEGVKSELPHLPLICMLGVVFFFPVGLLLWLFLRVFRLQKYRTWAIMAPFVYMFLLQVVGWPTASSRQEQFTHLPLPKSAREMKTHFSGDSLSNYSLTYYFKCSPFETEAFIRDLHLEPSSDLTDDEFSSAPFPGWPATHAWEEPAVFTGLVKDGYWTYCLKTDKSREQVYFSIKCG